MRAIRRRDYAESPKAIKKNKKWRKNEVAIPI